MGDVAEEPVAASHERSSTPPEGRFAKLPARVPPGDLVEEVPSDAAKDPDFGRDPDRDWLLRTT